MVVASEADTDIKNMVVASEADTDIKNMVVVSSGEGGITDVEKSVIGPVRIHMPAFDKLQNEPKSSANAIAEKLFDCFTHFSRNHAIVYFEESAAHKIDIRYKPLDYVCRGDHVHVAACSHLRAYRLMRGVEPLSANEFEDLSYADVIVAFANEVVRDEDEVEEVADA